MSLEALSSEIDGIIIRFLPAADVLSLSKTSKYYRSVTEPCLFRDVVFSPALPSKRQSLLLAILRRPKRAQHIKSLAVLQKDGKTPPSEEASSSSDDEGGIRMLNSAQKSSQCELSHKLPVAQSLINQITTKGGKTTEFALKWFRKFKEEHCSRGLDRTIAMVLCLATNVEAIEIDLSADHRFLFTRHLLNSFWGGQAEEKKFPFCKVKALTFRNVCSDSLIVDIPILPSLKKISYHGKLVGSLIDPLFRFPHHASQDEVQYALHTLEIPLALLKDYAASTLFSASVWRGLKRLLLIDGVPNYRQHYQVDFNYQTLYSVIKDRLPELEVFKLSNALQHTGRLWQPWRYGSFAELANLKHLTIDHDILILTFATPDEHFDYLINPHKFLPQPLESLTMTNIDVSALDSDASVFHKDKQALVQDMMAQCPLLKQLELRFDVRCWRQDFQSGRWVRSRRADVLIPRFVHGFCTDLIYQFACHEIKMFVSRQPGFTPELLLQAPFYEVEQVDERYWSD